MTHNRSFRLIIGSIAIGGAVFLFFEYLFKAPVFIKVFGILALAFVVYLVADWVYAAFRRKAGGKGPGGPGPDPDHA